MTADGAPGGAPRAMLLGSGLALLGLALLYNEWLLAPLARDAFSALTREKIRAVELGFGIAGLGFAAASEIVRRSPRLSRALSGRIGSACLLIGVGLLPLLVLDFGLRPFVEPKTTIFVPDPKLGWRMRPGAEGEWGEVRVRINARGLRGEPMAEKKPHGAPRVLFLGDSVTFGFGVERAADVFPSRVGELLARARDAPVEVVNAGVGGYSTWQELLWLRREGVDYEPDLVVLGFVLNDVTEPLSLVRYGGSGEGWQLARSARGELDRWLSASAIATVMRDGVATLRFGRDVRLGAQAAEAADVRRLTLEPGSFERAWRASLDGIAHIAELAAERGTPTLLVIFPYAFQLEDPIGTSMPQRRLLAFARTRGLPALDLLPILAELGPEGAFLDASHLSPAGHGVAARAIAERILRDGLLGAVGSRD